LSGGAPTLATIYSSNRGALYGAKQLKLFYPAMIDA
jgi:hypothetical protein